MNRSRLLPVTLSAALLLSACGPSLAITPQAVAELEPGPACPLEPGRTWRVDQAEETGWRTVARVRLVAIREEAGAEPLLCELALLDLQPLARIDPMAVRAVRTSLLELTDVRAYRGPGDTLLITSQLPRTSSEIDEDLEKYAGRVSRDDLEAPERASLLIRRSPRVLETLDRCQGNNDADWDQRVRPMLVRLGLAAQEQVAAAADGVGHDEAQPLRGTCGVLRSRAMLESLWAAGLPDAPSWRFVRD